MRSACLVALFCCLPWLAEAFFCGQHIVEVGESKVSVLKKCGEPTDKTTGSEKNSTQTQLPDNSIETKEVTSPTETWTYNFGPNKFMQVLTFRDDKLIDIKRGDYGF